MHISNAEPFFRKLWDTTLRSDVHPVHSVTMGAHTLTHVRECAYTHTHKDASFYTNRYIFKSLMDPLTRSNFGTFHDAMITVFQLLMGDSWSSVVYNAMATKVTTYGQLFAGFFVLSWFVFSRLIVFNLFVAVIIENFQVSETIENIRRPGRVTALKRVVRDSYKKFYSRTAAKNIGTRADETMAPAGKSSGGGAVDSSGASAPQAAENAIEEELKKDIAVLAKAVDHAKAEAQQGYAKKYVSWCQVLDLPCRGACQFLGGHLHVLRKKGQGTRKILPALIHTYAQTHMHTRTRTHTRCLQEMSANTYTFDCLRHTLTHTHSHTHTTCLQGHETHTNLPAPTLTHFKSDQITPPNTKESCLL
jgi:hypothetical protein